MEATPSKGSSAGWHRNRFSGGLGRVRHARRADGRVWVSDTGRKAPVMRRRAGRWGASLPCSPRFWSASRSRQRRARTFPSPRPTAGACATAPASLRPAPAPARPGSSGGGAGQLAYPEGVATDSSGDVYVADDDNERIDEFSAAGAFIKAYGWGVSDSASQFETCTSSCQAGISGGGAGQLDDPHRRRHR